MRAYFSAFFRTPIFTSWPPIMQEDIGNEPMLKSPNANEFRGTRIPLSKHSFQTETASFVQLINISWEGNLRGNRDGWLGRALVVFLAPGDFPPWDLTVLACRKRRRKSESPERVPIIFKTPQPSLEKNPKFEPIVGIIIIHWIKSNACRQMYG